MSDESKNLEEELAKAKKELEELRGELDKIKTVKGEKEDLLPEKVDIPLPVLERIEVKAPTDEEIDEKATNNLYDYKTSALGAIEENSAKAKETAREQKDATAKAKEASEISANEYYDVAKQKVNDDMLKRGLARSSTANLLNQEVENEKAKTLSTISKEYEDEIAKLDGQIAKAESERIKAINDFNVGYAIKYANEVASLKEERDKKQTEAIKYNNSLAEKESESYRDALLDQSELYGEALDQKTKRNELEKNTKNYVNYAKIYEIFRTMLRAMPKAEAKEKVTNDKIYSDNLSADYYLKLLSEFAN